MGNSRPPEKQSNLAFFKAFLNATVDSYSDLADKIGVSKMAIHRWFRIDDVRLSYIIACANVLGYNVYVSISDEPIDMMVSDSKVRKDGITLSVKRLHFLSYALKEQGITRVELAQRVGVTRDAVSYWYGRDDMTVKNIFACAKALKRNVNFRFVKTAPTVHPSRDKVLVTSSIYCVDTYEMSDREPAEKKGGSRD